MECPITLPVKYEMKITNTEYVVVDAKRKVIAKCNYEDDALFVQKAINSHEKQERLIESLINKVPESKMTNEDVVNVIEWLGLDIEPSWKKVKQALKKAEKE